MSDPVKPIEAPKVVGGMPIADISLKTDQFGSNVQLKDVTPAEALLLVAEFNRAAGGDPIVELTNERSVVRTDDTEIMRLKQKYAAVKVNSLFPGSSPALPKNFAEARTKGLNTSTANARLLTHNL